MISDSRTKIILAKCSLLDKVLPALAYDTCVSLWSRKVEDIPVLPVKLRKILDVEDIVHSVWTQDLDRDVAVPVQLQAVSAMISHVLWNVLLKWVQIGAQEAQSFTESNRELLTTYRPRLRALYALTYTALREHLEERFLKVNLKIDV